LRGCKANWPGRFLGVTVPVPTISTPFAWWGTTDRRRSFYSPDRRQLPSFWESWAEFGDWPHLSFVLFPAQSVIGSTRLWRATGTESLGGMRVVLCQTPRPAPCFSISNKPQSPSPRADRGSERACDSDHIGGTECKIHYCEFRAASRWARNQTPPRRGLQHGR